MGAEKEAQYSLRPVVTDAGLRRLALREQTFQHVKQARQVSLDDTEQNIIAHVVVAVCQEVPQADPTLLQRNGFRCSRIVTADRVKSFSDNLELTLDGSLY